VEEWIRRELTAIEEQQHGVSIIRVGKALRWTAMVPACFVCACSGMAIPGVVTP